MGLAKFSAKFMGLAVSFFNDYVRLAVSIFFTNLSRRIDFFKAKKAAKYRFVSILYMSLDNIGTAQARFHNTLKSRSRKWRSQNVSGSQRKALVSPSRKVSHLPFTTPYFGFLSRFRVGSGGFRQVPVDSGWVPRFTYTRFEPWPGTLCYVLGQDTSLSQCLSPPRCTNGYRQI